MKRGGTLYFATDANAHAGTDEGSVLTSLRDKGVRVNSMQTGACDDEGTGFSTATLAARGSLNHDGADGPSSALALIESGDFANSIDFYSQLAAATGGSYIYIPEINFFSGDGAVYFANTVENVLFATIAPRIVSATPHNVPRGSIVSVELAAQGTSFLNDTTVEFAGAGIAVNAIERLSAVSLRVTLQIADDAPLGFSDATAQTVLSDEVTESALGEGILNVVDAVSTPTLLSASPSVVHLGDTADVTIHAGATHFVDGTSVSNFGGGITFNSVTVTGDTSAVVHITVAGVSESIDPIVRTIDPVGGPSEGGYPAVIGGEDFSPDAVVKWNGAEINAVVSKDGTEITVTVPPGTPGRAVAVDVGNPGAMHSGRVIFFYDAAPGEKGADGPAGADGKDGLTGEPPAGGTTPPETIIYQQVISQACGNGLCGAFGASMFAVVMLTLVTAKLARRRRRR